jgi:hypothetical protein
VDLCLPNVPKGFIKIHCRDCLLTLPICILPGRGGCLVSDANLLAFSAASIRESTYSMSLEETYRYSSGSIFQLMLIAGSGLVSGRHRKSPSISTKCLGHRIAYQAVKDTLYPLSMISDCQPRVYNISLKQDLIHHSLLFILSYIAILQQAQSLLAQRTITPLGPCSRCRCRHGISTTRS